MSRMSMAIAMARRRTGGRHKIAPPLPAEKVTRDGGLICPICLKFGRNGCSQHNPTGEKHGN